MKSIAIIGITGSIGLSTIDVVRKHPDKFKITLATSHNKVDQLKSLIKEFNIPQAVITNCKFNNKNKGIMYGQESLLQILEDEKFDVVINAVSGSAGLIYSYHILKNNHKLALANKESLVMAGHILTGMSSNIIPIDSEHSALFQIMNGLKPNDVKKAILTASGGPFLDTPLNQFDHITPEQALQHPTWSMGNKITIDSATMFNKGLEAIEAHWLFGFDYSQIQAVIHPQSIVHSMIECQDGSILTQMSIPSMQLPILYALTYPHHIKSDLTKTNICDLPPLIFLPIEKTRFPLYYLTIEAGISGGLIPTALNAANEAAIKLFFEGKINFPQIYEIIDNYLNDFNNITDPDIDTILDANKYVFNEVYQSL